MHEETKYIFFKKRIKEKKKQTVDKKQMQSNKST